jgi:hypothetical protein
MLDWHSLSCRSRQDAVQLFFLLIFTFGEKLSQVPPVPEKHSITPPPPINASPPHFMTVYNKCTGGGWGCCVSIWAPSLPGPSFVHVWSSVCCLSYISRHPPVRFLGKAHAVLEKSPSVLSDHWRPQIDASFSTLPGSHGKAMQHTHLLKDLLGPKKSVVSQDRKQKVKSCWRFISSSFSSCLERCHLTTKIQKHQKMLGDFR